MKKSAVKRFVLKGETVRALQSTELIEIVGGVVSGAACPPSVDPASPCQCTDVKSTCASTEQVCGGPV
jgi:hypothetical protein